MVGLTCEKKDRTALNGRNEMVLNAFSVFLLLLASNEDHVISGPCQDIPETRLDHICMSSCIQSAGARVDMLTEEPSRSNLNNSTY